VTERPLARRLADAPGAQAVVVGASWTGAMVYAHALRGQGGVDMGQALGSLSVGALLTVILAVVLVQRRRRPSRAPRWVEVSEALDDARLPEHADASVWSLVLLRRRELVTTLGSVGALLTGSVILVGGVAVSLVGASPIAWTLPAVVAVLLLVVRVVRDREVARVDAVLQPLLDFPHARGDDAPPDD
jgi:hypothetical protein